MISEPDPAPTAHERFPAEFRELAGPSFPGFLIFVPRTG
ncbi:hypothetical protein CLV40_101128 [Actinokineospora auranticolor]|uniref:Uncharacterized protein n=1 Tax=Actinokineospora auranticolor TaxID=155976 RepID=A0A2S6H0B5_9PSEU|nr:hypothetical protein CLV40_101128 [Actinokineospora auranticolor]